MRRTKFDGEETQVLEADPRSALDTAGRRIYCTAKGCPIKASVYFAAPLCSWHDTAEPKDWPRVTADLEAIIARRERPVRPEINPADWVIEARKRVIRRSAGHGVLDAAREGSKVARVAIDQALRMTGDIE